MRHIDVQDRQCRRIGLDLRVRAGGVNHIVAPMTMGYVWCAKSFADILPDRDDVVWAHPASA